VLRWLRLKQVHRALGVAFDDTIVIPKGPAGNEIDMILTKTLRALKRDGTWKLQYDKVHPPYDDWQPSQQSW
jgi:polar amino acid transport system substrate-binding protein